MPPLRAFISYAHADEALRKELETHLAALRREGLLATWTDRQILPGAEWQCVIDEGLEQAELILLLVSSDFVNSNYCYAPASPPRPHADRLALANAAAARARALASRSCSAALLLRWPSDGSRCPS